MRYGLRSPALDCSTCDERTRKKKNCNNRQGRIKTIVHKSEWLKWPENLKHVDKWGDLKFFECPRSAITNRTWELIGLVNETTNLEGEVLHLPFDGTWLDQPEFYRTAVQIVKRERIDHKNKQIAKKTAEAKRKKHGSR